MAAAGQNGIPTAFVVNKEGVVAWIGHPMALQETVLNEVLDGTYDLAKAAADFEKQQKEIEKQQIEAAKRNAPWMAISRAMQKKDWDAAMDKVAEAEKVVPKAEHDRLDVYRFNILLGIILRLIKSQRKSVTPKKMTPNSRTNWPGRSPRTRRSSSATWPWLK